MHLKGGGNWKRAGSLFAIIDLIQGAKSLLLYFIWRVGGGGGGGDFHRKNFVNLFFLHLNVNDIYVTTAP